MASLRGRFTRWFSPFELQCAFSSAARGVTYSHLQMEFGIPQLRVRTWGMTKTDESSGRNILVF